MGTTCMPFCRDTCVGGAQGLASGEKPGIDVEAAGSRACCLQTGLIAPGSVQNTGCLWENTSSCAHLHANMCVSRAVWWEERELKRVWEQSLSRACRAHRSLVWCAATPVAFFPRCRQVKIYFQKKVSYLWPCTRIVFLLWVMSLYLYFVLIISFLLFSFLKSTALYTTFDEVSRLMEYLETKCCFLLHGKCW